MHSSCKAEKEGKARCCFAFCNKLFKDNDFLRKHLISKHPTFAADLFLVEDEPFMRKRYEEEEISQRPLPPVEVESNGTIVRRSVKEIRDKYTHPPPPPSLPLQPIPFLPPPAMEMQGSFGMGPPQHYAGSNQQSYNPSFRRHSGGGGGRGGFPPYNQPPDTFSNGKGRAGGYKRSFEDSNRRDQWSPYPNNYEQASAHPVRGGGGTARGDDVVPPVTPDHPHPAGSGRGAGEGGRREEIAGPTPAPSTTAGTTPGSVPLRQYMEPRSADNNERRLFSYVDVDAPKVRDRDTLYSYCISHPRLVKVSMCSYSLTECICESQSSSLVTIVAYLSVNPHCIVLMCVYVHSRVQYIVELPCDFNILEIRPLTQTSSFLFILFFLLGQCCQHRLRSGNPTGEEEEAINWLGGST